MTVRQDTSTHGVVSCRRWFSRAILAISVFAAALACANPGRAATGPALVFDTATGQVLIEERAGEPWYPASLTKLMTAYLTFAALRSGKLSLDGKIPVSGAAAKLPPSKIGMPVGSRVSVDFALKALLVHSANDMAVVLAEAVAGSEAKFVAEMNATARRMGLAGTRFANPHGLHDPHQVTTARDMGLLAAAILTDYPEHHHYFSAPNLTVGKTRLRNRNMLLRQMEAADGMKTGYICDAGFNLVASASLGGRKLIAVVLGAKSAKARADLAQVLLEAAAARAAEDSRAGARVADLTAVPAGSQTPHNMKQTVCSGGSRVAIAKAQHLDGWGVSFGRFDNELTADAVLAGRLLATRRLVPAGRSGVVRVPSSKDYLAVVWGMPQPHTLTLCNYLRRQNAHCEVMPPEAFAEFARLAGLEAERRSEPAGRKPKEKGQEPKGSK